MRYIDTTNLMAKRAHWGNGIELWKNPTLKIDFKNYFHGKCWYTEIFFAGFDVDIDHFRPKSEVAQYKDCYYNAPLEKCGYHWLKNDVHNYRACCIFANRPRGEGGKRTWFPLKKNSPLLTDGGTEIEEPMLLDPCVKSDVNLLSFMGNEIGCTSTDPNEQERVKISSVIYNFMDTDIKQKRIRVWHEVEILLEELESGDISEAACLRRLKEMVSCKAEFSACAISAVNSLLPDHIKHQLDLEL
ncbi:conserved hypothetical protein [uncultured Eubacteriales bacterium]|uniref:TIGR02646 family protein n=1 Tax=uncultured Eubacteriales bacterium TaxID=172733 RepID=A0A212KEK3_9FIRM|nr:conserved hypothetical protein [uncultured Eubacteriales bacterium]